jgi:hypothetical protein
VVCGTSHNSSQLESHGHENGVPMFKGQNGFKYEMWSIGMKVFLQAQGHYIWLSVVIGYDSSKMEYTATKKELRNVGP